MAAFLGLVFCAGGLASCDRGGREVPQVAMPIECTPMPAECPAQLSCEVTAAVEGGHEVRVCGGSACCQSFCDLNGCDRCCQTAISAPPAR